MPCSTTSRARGSRMDLARGLETLLVAAVVAALAPVLVALLPGPRIPQVVVLLAGGVLIGPQVLGWADRPAIDLLANVGLGFLFLLAGYELDLHLFRERPGRLAIVAWLVTVALAAATVGVLAALGFVRAFVPVALGLTTTALGTLLPILRDNDMLGGRFGRYLLAAGAVGELFPVLAIAVFLGASNKFVALGSLVAVGILAAGAELRAAAGAGQPAGADPPGGRRLHRPDDRPLDRRAAAAPAADRRGVRPRRGPRRVPGRDRAAPLGAGRRPCPGGQARRYRLRLLHPAVLRGLGDVPGHPLHRRGAAAVARCSSSCCWRSGGCRPCSCTATRCRRSGGSS